ncbi:sigma-54-dependent transcriptional regulator [Desulfitibacter alkalitolerans]|uniref:sigma-54-dependent transcriptional regulator n=1 Tax=Desulfitibacter alkalitolerans TaxID=264641 RepID=UPI00048A3924|nr:sigma-54 dependent transcriptional regulator [Desulfitibacter alkalitolerans]
MYQYNILIIDDDTEVGNFFTYLLDNLTYKLEIVHDGRQALNKLQKNQFQLALVDLKLPDTDGIALLGKIKETQNNCEVIIMTGYSTIKSAVKAIQLGAFDYINKPFENIYELECLVKKALEQQEVVVSYKNYEEACSQVGLVVGDNEKFRKLINFAAKVAPKDLNILITGETGTGKELMARFIHLCSKRKDEAFLAINCSAIVESLLESELFGHEKGSFTGASHQRKGFFQLADRGTLFLDEIGEASIGIQVKLLRAIETGEFIPIGATKKISTDVRIIAATNLDLEEAVVNNTFRQDLFYRLDVLRLHLPPLRERKEDIPLLVDYILEKRINKKGLKTKGFAFKTIKRLMEYPWPGNIRELINAIEQSTALAEGNMILPKHLPEKIFKGTNEISDSKKISLEDIDTYSEEQLISIANELNEIVWKISKKMPDKVGFWPQKTLEEVEQEMIEMAMQSCKGNITAAAKILGIGRNTLYRKVKNR